MKTVNIFTTKKYSRFASTGEVRTQQLVARTHQVGQNGTCLAEKCVVVKVLLLAAPVGAIHSDHKLHKNYGFLFTRDKVNNTNHE